jgi:hypothetical protein
MLTVVGELGAIDLVTGVDSKRTDTAAVDAILNLQILINDN